jgi:hypothetical protein
MGEGGAFVAGAITGGLVGGGAGFQAGYNQRDAELQPYINRLLSQIGMQNSQIEAKDRQIAELQRQLQTKERSIPVISEIRKKLSGS